MSSITPRQRIIKRLNRDFSKLIGCKIPMSQPITSHQTKFASDGGYRWYFTYDSSLESVSEQSWIVPFGSTVTMTELLKGNKEWVVIKEDWNHYDIQLREDYEKELHHENIYQKERCDE